MNYDDFYDIAKDSISDAKQRFEHFNMTAKEKHDLHKELVEAIKNIEKRIDKADSKNRILDKRTKIIATLGLVFVIIQTIIMVIKD